MCIRDRIYPNVDEYMARNAYAVYVNEKKIIPPELLGNHSPAYAPGTPNYAVDSPPYNPYGAPGSPAYNPNTPPSSPPYAPGSPAYNPYTPPGSPAYNPNTPPSSPPYAPGSPPYPPNQSVGFRIDTDSSQGSIPPPPPPDSGSSDLTDVVIIPKDSLGKPKLEIEQDNEASSILINKDLKKEKDSDDEEEKKETKSIKI